MNRLIATVFVFSLRPTAALSHVAGTASVIDGDTLKIHGQREAGLPE